MSKKISNEIINQCIDLHFNEKISLSKIAEIVNVNYNTISRYIRNKGLTPIYHGRTIVNNELIEKIRCLHIEKQFNITQISKKLNLDVQTVKKLLIKNNIPYQNSNMNLKVRPNLFEQIETEEDAYWLGFIYADGYISDNGNFELSLNYRDFKQLEKFARYSFFKGNIVKKQKVSGGFYRCRLSFTAIGIKENFFNVGIIPRKSSVLIFPNKNILPTTLIKHFIRGYVDGDGSLILASNKKTNQKDNFQLSILGTVDILTNIHYWIQKTVSLYTKNNNVKKLYSDKRMSSNNIKILSYGGTKKGAVNVINILNWLYLDNNISLDRKQQKYKELCRAFKKLNVS